MEKLPSVLGELRDSQVLSRRSPYQANASQLINLSHQWLGLLDRTKDSSFASATRLLQSLWTISAGCLMFTSKSQQKGCKLWLPRDLFKLIPLPMESRSNNTMPTMGDSLSTYSSITVRNRVRRYPYVESVRTSKMALLKEGSRISLKGQERPFYTPFTGGPQQSQSTCGHMRFATSMRYTTPLLLLRRANHHWRLSHRLPYKGPRSWISTHLSVPSMCYTTDSKAVDHVLTSGSDDQGWPST